MKYTPRAFIGSFDHLMPNGFALFPLEEPIHKPSVFVLLILSPEILRASHGVKNLLESFVVLTIG